MIREEQIKEKYLDIILLIDTFLLMANNALPAKASMYNIHSEDTDNKFSVS